MAFIYICKSKDTKMRISLICIGKTDDAEIKKLIAYYIPRLPKHFNFEFIEIPDVKNAKNLTDIQLKKEEAKLFLNYLDNTDTVVLLDEKVNSLHPVNLHPK